MELIAISVHQENNSQSLVSNTCFLFLYFSFHFLSADDMTTLVGFQVTVPNLKVFVFDPRAAVFYLSLKYFILCYCILLYVVYFFCIRHIMFGCMIFLCLNRRLQSILVKY